MLGVPRTTAYGHLDKPEPETGTVPRRPFGGRMDGGSLANAASTIRTISCSSFATWWWSDMVGMPISAAARRIVAPAAPPVSAQVLSAPSTALSRTW
ncbi:hypothetical protein ABZZ04_36570 [Streptomyces sp. NPDC006435]|uniref:hypothetical protein n=1 Tax=Streptomyces sp. NPDC006435 TaxID=3154300 RepID=UPI0033AAA21D